MSQVRIQGNPSGTGTLTIASPNTNSDFTLNLPANAGTIPVLTSVNNNSVIFVNSSGQATTSTGFVFDGSGNVGIGTSSPSGRLEVVGAIRSILNSGQGGQSLIGAISGVSNGYEVNVTTGNVQTYRWHNGGTVSMELDSSGNFRFNSGYGSVATAFGCRAWVNFNGTGTVAIRASGNVSSITDNGVGTYVVNFTTAMPDANYSVAISSNNQVTNVSTANNINTFGTSSFAWQHVESNAVADSAILCASVFR